MNRQSLAQKWQRTTKTYLAFGLVVSLCMTIFCFNTAPVNAATAASPASPAVVFNADAGSLGAIPDGTDPVNCQVPGAPRNVTFNVSGVTGNISAVSVSMTLTHTWAGDVVATLIAPGGAVSHVLFGYVGATTAGGSGDSSNFGGTYVFSDAAPATPTLWQAAASAPGSNDIIAPGNYRSTTIGGSASGGTVTSINSVFSSLTPAQANGVWTLRLTDGCAADTGSVSAASIDITAGGPQVTPKPFGDFYGSGRSSFATIGVQGANLVWRLRNNGGTGADNILWGLSATDVPTPGYYDSDNRTDVAVWRPNADPAQNFYFIRQSSNGALRAQEWGIQSDFVNREADYDGDGLDDITVLRRSSGQWQWIWMGSQGNTVRVVNFGIGNNTATEDVPIAGADYTGDGRADLTVIRLNAGTDTWLIGDSNTGAVVRAENWGEFNTDFIVVGDFLGDARADFAVWRAAGTGGDFGNWFIRENGGTGTLVRNFGIPSATAASRDVPVAGDFNGDGKYDIAVYRPSNSAFYWLGSPASTTLAAQAHGNVGDFPVGGLRAF